MFIDKGATPKGTLPRCAASESREPSNEPGSAPAERRDLWESTNHKPSVPPGLIVLILMVGILICSAAVIPRAAASTALGTGVFASLAAPDQNIDFSRFYHNNPNHARLPCLLCHRREGTAATPTLPGGGGHLPCAGCHAKEFTNSSSPVCTICHTNTQSGALKSFPPLKSFNMKFDHSVHARELRVSCATCHRPQRNGQALSIPMGPSAHDTCYRCHAAQAQANGRDISSCSTCHQAGGYARTSTQAPAFKVGFNHARHASRQLSCTECHNVRAGMPQRKQVTAPLPLNHHAPAGTASCATCHNGKRAFGGDDFTACTKCHRGPQWHF